MSEEYKVDLDNLQPHDFEQGKWIIPMSADLIDDQSSEVFMLQEIMEDPDLPDYFRDALEARIKWLSMARPKQIPPKSVVGTWFLCAGRGFGKMTDLLTSILTTKGWSTVGELNEGDFIFDENGKPTKVIQLHPITTPEHTYRFHFSDGTFVDSCKDHLWTTWTHADRKALLRSEYEEHDKFPENWPQWKSKSLRGSVAITPKEKIIPALKAIESGLSINQAAIEHGVSYTTLRRYYEAGGWYEKVANTCVKSLGPKTRTTQQIIDTFTYGKRSDLNHSIPVAKPVEFPERNLVVDPYVLGYWLGDGSSGSAEFTCHEDDQYHIIHELEKSGFKTRSFDYDSQKIGTKGLHVLLNKLNLLKNKHAPDDYLFASVDQRLALLQGLMDSDGTISKAGHVSFSNTNRRLIDAVIWLARSLGQKPIVSDEKFKTFQVGVTETASWQVQWTPTIQCFRLERKAKRYEDRGSGQSLRNHHRMIVRWEELPGVPMRCISVDSPNHLYLVDEALIATHNTFVCANETFWKAISRPNIEIAVIAPTLDNMRRVCFEGPSGLLKVIPPSCILNYNKSNQELTLVNGSKFSGFAAEAYERLRGPQFHYVWMEELAAWGAKLEATYEQARLVLRLPFDGNGDPVDNIAFISTTPKGYPLITRLLEDPEVTVVHGTSHENYANLSLEMQKYIKSIEHTDMGRQEIYAEVLDFSDMISMQRKYFRCWPEGKVHPIPEHIVISIDPAYKDGKKNDSSACVILGVARVTVKEPGPHPYIPDVIVNKTKKKWGIFILGAWKKKLLYPALKQEVMDTYTKWKDAFDKAPRESQEDVGYTDMEGAVDVLIEDKASGISLLQDFATTNMPIVPFNPENRSKKTRVDDASQALVNGNVFGKGHIDETTGKKVFLPHIELVVKQAEKFTGVLTSETDVDDVLDAFAQALLYLRRKGYSDYDTDGHEAYFTAQSREDNDGWEEKSSTFKPNFTYGSHG